MLNRKILFTIIPKGNWIILAVAISFSIIGGEFLKLANIGFNLFVFLIGLKLAVFIHEIGHLLFALLVGGTPRRMILGKGHKVVENKVKGVKIILNSNFNSGLAYAAFDNLKSIRIKLLIFISGGYLTNFLVAALFFTIFNFSTEFTSRILLSSIIIFTNLITGISVLIPHYSSYQGLRLYSDGLSILRIPFQKKSHLAELSSVNELLDAYDLLESKKFKEAISIYENFKSITDGSNIANINLSIAHIKLGDYTKAVELIEEILPLVDEEPFNRFKNYIYNNLAWAYLLLNRMDEADEYSELAYTVDPNTEYIRGTRASVLIEQGEFEEGINLLASSIDFNFPNSQTLVGSIYVGLAYHEINDHHRAMKYVKFVEDHLLLLDLDERTLYERAKIKWQYLTNYSNTYSNKEV